ncbi:MAG: class I SAM-dependent methyltransferase [Candidatus Jordarchaeum sp.]|uniref:class I SAM-dependent methyltransferase n=1 Tax=Candidatus Jordarchaeum sp. TaxID=2823881 RepID=UPI00404A9209
MDALKDLTEEKMNMMYKNENERLFNKKWNWDSYRYQERFSLAINLVRKNISRKARIIDIGCAQGNFSTRLAAQGYKVVGVDIRPSLIKYSRWKARRMKVGSENIDFVVGSALALPITDNKYDCVLFLEIIEHLNRPEKALAELKRVLNENGTLIFSTVNSFRILGRKSFSQFKELIQKKRDKRGYPLWKRAFI